VSCPSCCSTITDARDYAHQALSGNSMTTMRNAKAYAEGIQVDREH
jgi:hypothetical protein